MNSTLEALFNQKRVLIIAGAGGVGKTTTAASLGLLAASKLSKKVLVLTVDPAKRLADTMGISSIGNEITRVDISSLQSEEASGELFAAMLDTKKSWDDLVGRYAPNPRVRDEILNNPIYKNVASRFVQSHDYIAMESLYELHSRSQYDLIIVDTPPSRSAISFLDAPSRMAEFFSSKLLRWIIAPYRNRFVAGAFRPFYQVADRIIGSQFLAEVAEFFMLFQSMYDGFIQRAQAVEALLKSPDTSFLVVAAPEFVPVREAEFLLGALKDRGLDCGALVINRSLPRILANKTSLEAARNLAFDGDALLKFGPTVADSKLLASVLSQVGATFIEYSQLYQQERLLLSTLSLESGKILQAPYIEHDVTDLATLDLLGSRVDSVVY